LKPINISLGKGEYLHLQESVRETVCSRNKMG